MCTCTPSDAVSAQPCSKLSLHTCINKEKIAPQNGIWARVFMLQWIIMAICFISHCLQVACTIYRTLMESHRKTLDYVCKQSHECTNPHRYLNKAKVAVNSHVRRSMGLYAKGCSDLQSNPPSKTTQAHSDGNSLAGFWL